MEKSQQLAGAAQQREFYEGKPTGLQLTLVCKTTPTEGQDRKYVKGGKEAQWKLQVYEWKREAGTNREWFIQGETRRYYATGGSTIRKPWAPHIRKNNCQDCGTWGHFECGQNNTRPQFFNCNQTHLTEDCTIGASSLEEVQREKKANLDAREADLKAKEEERNRLVKEEEARVARYKERMAKLNVEIAAGKTAGRA